MKFKFSKDSDMLDIVAETPSESINLLIIETWKPRIEGFFSTHNNPLKPDIRIGHLHYSQLSKFEDQINLIKHGGNQSAISDFNRIKFQLEIWKNARLVANLHKEGYKINEN